MQCHQRVDRLFSGHVSTRYIYFLWPFFWSLIGLPFFLSGFNGGLPQHFTLTVYKQSSENGELSLAANLSSPFPTFTVSGLDPGSKYVGELTGHNVKGMGVPSQIHVYTLKLPEKLIPNIEDSSASGAFNRNPPLLIGMRSGMKNS